jgi:guanylate kinase
MKSKSGGSRKPEASGKLIIISAPSGAGKTTIVRHLLTQPFNLEFSVSGTSRPPRGNEKDGVDYYFLSKAEFIKKTKNNEFLEWEEVYPGIFYGTLKSEVARRLGEGKNIIFDVDVKGGLNIKEFYGKQALAVFVSPPSLETLRQRLHNRSTETEEKIAVRIAKAAFEMSFASKFDAILINDDLETTLKEAEILVKSFIYGKKN